MTPPPCYVSLSLARGTMGPPPAPRPVSQSTPRLPVPATGSLAAPSPPSIDRVPTSIDRLSLDVGRLLATPSVRSERRVSHAEVSLGLSGLSPGVSAAVESPKTRPRSHDVGSSRRQALLAAAATATVLIDTASLLPAPSMAPMPTGFRNYGLPDSRSKGPTLPWNQSHGGWVLAGLDETYRMTPWVHQATSTERSGFASSGALLTPWLSSQVPAPLSRYHGVTSPLVSS